MEKRRPWAQGEPHSDINVGIPAGKEELLANSETGKEEESRPRAHGWEH